MRGAVGFLVLVLSTVGALGQEAPLQSGVPVEHGAAGAGGAYAMEPGMIAPKILSAVAAVYPETVQVDGGVVRCLLSMIIDEQGMPQLVHMVHSGGEAFDAAAMEAVRQTKFEPGLRDGKTVPVRTIVRVVFTADKAAAVPEILRRKVVDSANGVAADFGPRVITGKDAEYSEEARRKKISGTVLVSLLVTEAGMPAEVTVERGLGYGLDEKAVEAVRQYRFRPAMKDGKPVAQHIKIEVSFNIF